MRAVKERGKMEIAMENITPKEGGMEKREGRRAYPTAMARS